MKELLFAHQVAELLGIKERTWTSYVARGQPLSNPAPLPRPSDYTRVNGRLKPRWRKSEIEAWQRRRGEASQ